MVRQPTWTVATDFCVLFFGLACFYGVVLIARYWSGGAIPVADIDRIYGYISAELAAFAGDGLETAAVTAKER